MPRQKTSPFEEFVLVTSRLPWWVGIVLALVSYAVLHQIAGRPLTSATVGEMVVKGMLASLAMLGQYILPFGFGLAALISGINALRQKRLYEKAAAAADATALNQMSWGDFERLVAEHFQRAGFQVSRAGGNGPDGGIDLVVRKNSEKHLVQCKQWKAYKVGVQPVREFYGVMAANGATGGYFVSSGVYTDEAKKFAQGLNLELIDGPQLKSLIDRVRMSPAPSVSQQETKALAPACTAPAISRPGFRQITTGPGATGSLWPT
ncbi:restriction endonuclease [Trichlorobacter lovleyi]|uniref:restriction endonuclease n=1 Tax=Trichlorobacter lovleyi TaxID=313985 RepID=UPI0023F47F18|nr:restriction endonuclease [Trichlorobacter lovleyi]